MMNKRKAKSVLKSGLSVV